jgi:hypothetical protein
VKVPIASNGLCAIGGQKWLLIAHNHKREQRGCTPVDIG